jgi:tRNA (guanine37-N1)-methyltransferase
LRLDIFTLFPEAFGWFSAQRHVRNAISEGSELRFINYRDTTPLGAGQVDDTPYGGGSGMVLRVDVVDAALQAAYGDQRAGRRIVLLAPSGRMFDEQLASELAEEPDLTLLCGRYEGVDERVRDHLVTDTVSIGPYVLAGGELPAMVIADAVLRKLPGSLGAADSALEESFSEALEGAPEYPHYTRPPTFRGWGVPDVLVSGDHERVRQWRRERSRERSADSH